MITKAEFNRNYSLELDHKFVGLDRLTDLGIADLFWHKFTKMVTRMKPYLYNSSRVQRCIPFRVSGHQVKLYYR